MIYCTTKGKLHRCPMWGINVTISAKYRYFDETNPYIAKYANCSCPIIENLKKPIYEQDKEFAIYRFCNMQKECLSSIKFKDIIDTSKDG